MANLALAEEVFLIFGRAHTSERKRKLSDDMTKKMSKVSLDDAFAGLEGEEKKNLNLIIKGDVQGSVEAIKQSPL